MPEDPFRVLVRRDAYGEPTLTVRFTVTDGMGQLTLPSPDTGGRLAVRPENLGVFGEERGVEPDVLRGARFVHILNQERQSFSLARLTPEICALLEPDRWIELRPLVDHGFRHLVPPDELGGFPATPAPAPARVQLPTPGPAPQRAAAPPPSPASAVEIAPSPVSVTVVTVSPSEGVLSSTTSLEDLTRDAAIGHLRNQLLVVESLKKRLEDTERKLAASRGRERDLLDVLAKWQGAE